MAALRLGLFGGSFDPPHLGHLVVAQDVSEYLDLHRLLFVPARNPPHKQDRSLAPASLRLEMIRGLVAEDDRFGVSQAELGRSGPSFTVDTLRHYREVHPRAELFFIMGADQALTLESWHRPRVVEELATLVVMAREGTDPPAGDFVPAPVTRIDISSSSIRARVRDGRPIRYLVPEVVRDVIERNRLYRAVS